MHLSFCRHGFVEERSVATNMVGFPQKIYQPLDDNSNKHIVAFYTDFSKAFDKVPHFELLKKVANIGVGSCLLEVLASKFDERMQFVRVANVSSKTFDITSGVPQGSLLGPPLFFIFLNDLPAVVKFGDPFLFADDFKILAHGKLETEIQSDLEQVAQWVKEIKMELLPNKCFQLVRKERIPSIRLARGPPEASNSKIDIGVVVNASLTWSEHLDN